jgi:hypothetical protein
MSSFTNDGMMGMENSTNMRRNAMADSMAVTVRVRTLTLVFIVNRSFSGHFRRKKAWKKILPGDTSADCKNCKIIQCAASFIQTILSVSEFHRFGPKARGLYRRWGLTPRPEADI